MNQNIQNPAVKPRDVIQFSNGPKRGMFAQIISSDGKCLTRDMDGSQYSFNPGPEETFVVVGTAALGPKLDERFQPAPALPPALNPAELLEPLPAEVKAKPMNAMNAERVKPAKAKPGPKPKPEPYTGPKLPYAFTVKNGLGDEAEVIMQVRADTDPKFYKGTAILKATQTIPPTKPFEVSWRLKE